MANDATKEAYQKALAIPAYRREAVAQLEALARHSRQIFQALEDQRRALNARKIGEAEFHAKRIESYAQQIDSCAALTEIAIRESSGRDPF
jgi:cytochrome P450